MIAKIIMTNTTKIINKSDTFVQLRKQNMRQTVQAYMILTHGKTEIS